MAIYPIRTFGDPVLRATAVDVTDDAESLHRLVDDMLETMYEAPGVGLAGPQIGISKRIFVADIGEGPFAMVNPELVEVSGSWTFDEGCLSVPGYYWPIKRPGYAKAKGYDIDGNPVELEGDELMGRVLQHEIDHLHGMLLLERLSRRAKKQALRDIREDAMRSAGYA
ncbi:MAG: peptide deformylase [Acidimicrobiia bacterium]|nr:peptide deformylase [Acidimicrobiia bacterium]MDX2466877.1 peptide deformylase [Acidimicrobiia bacterium]